MTGVQTCALPILELFQRMVIQLKEVISSHTNLSKIHLNFGLQREKYDGKYRQFRVFRFDPKDFLAHFLAKLSSYFVRCYWTHFNGCRWLGMDHLPKSDFDHYSLGVGGSKPENNRELNHSGL